MKHIYKLVKKFTGYEEKHMLPEDRNGLANEMGNYFDSKIVGIRNEIESRKYALDDLKVKSLPKPTVCSSSFSSFNEVSQEELQGIICEVTNKTCSLDPIPTNLVKKCSDQLHPIIMKVLN